MKSKVLQWRYFSDEWTPLHVAAQQGSHEIARLLIEHGADVHAKQKGKNSSRVECVYILHMEIPERGISL